MFGVFVYVGIRVRALPWGVLRVDAWKAFLPIHDGLEQIDLSEEVSDEEIQAALATIAPASNWFAYVTGQELWRRREVPAPLATAKSS